MKCCTNKTVFILLVLFYAALTFSRFLNFIYWLDNNGDKEDTIILKEYNKFNIIIFMLFVSYCIFVVPMNEFRLGFPIGSAIWTIAHFWSHYLNPFETIDIMSIFGQYITALIFLCLSTHLNSKQITLLFVHKTNESKAYKNMANLVDTLPDGVLMLKRISKRNISIN